MDLTEIEKMIRDRKVYPGSHVLFDGRECVVARVEIYFQIEYPGAATKDIELTLTDPKLNLWTAALEDVTPCE